MKVAFQDISHAVLLVSNFAYSIQHAIYTGLVAVVSDSDQSLDVKGNSKSGSDLI